MVLVEMCGMREPDLPSTGRGPATLVNTVMKLRVPHEAKNLFSI
jgi:hypothetical protein